MPAVQGDWPDARVARLRRHLSAVQRDRPSEAGGGIVKSEVAVLAAGAKICGWEPIADGYICTREVGHGGPHVAHGVAPVMAIERDGKWIPVAL